jgi:hypothetical protein
MLQNVTEWNSFEGFGEGVPTYWIAGLVWIDKIFNVARVPAL